MIPTHTEEAIRLGRTMTAQSVMLIIELRRVNLNLCRAEMKAHEMNAAIRSATKAQLCRETTESYLEGRRN